MTQIELISTDLICENLSTPCFLPSIKNVAIMNTSIFQMSLIKNSCYTSMVLSLSQIFLIGNPNKDSL